MINSKSRDKNVSEFLLTRLDNTGITIKMDHKEQMIEISKEVSDKIKVSFPYNREFVEGIIKENIYYFNFPPPSTGED